jgi:coenzyme PQQ precursor peptide PqqA
LNNDIQAIASQDFMESIMAWTTPILVEICIGLEINGYLPAEFWSANQPFAMPVRRGRPSSCSVLRQARGFAAKPCAQASLPSRLMATARFCLTVLLTPDLRAQTAAAFTAARRRGGPIAAVDRRRGCEVDYIAAAVVNCRAGAFAAS